MFQECNRYQKMLLILLVILPVIFCVLYVQLTSRVGFLYKDAIFVPEERNGNTFYSASVQGVESAFTVTADKAVTFQYGDKLYGPYTARIAPSAIPQGLGFSSRMTGVEICDGDETLFRGGVIKMAQEGFQLMLVNEDGTLSGITVSAVLSNGTTVDGEGNVIDPMRPGIHTILELMHGPDLTHKGHWGFWFLGIFFSILNAVSILFADELFYWRLSFRVSNPDDIEPSELEIAGRYVSWTLLTACILWIYFLGLR